MRAVQCDSDSEIVLFQKRIKAINNRDREIAGNVVSVSETLTVSVRPSRWMDFGSQVSWWVLALRP
jgi:hypothetical protein